LCHIPVKNIFMLTYLIWIDSEFLTTLRALMHDHFVNKSLALLSSLTMLKYSYTDLTAGPIVTAMHGRNNGSRQHKILFILYLDHSYYFDINTIKMVMCAELSYSLLQNN